MHWLVTPLDDPPGFEHHISVIFLHPNQCEIKTM